MTGTNPQGAAGNDVRRARALAERASDLALICSPDYVIRYCGPALFEMFGYRADEVIGVSAWTFCHPEDVDELQHHWDTAQAEPGGHTRLEIRVAHRDGSWRWVEERLTNLLDDPAVGGMVFNCRDVTDRRAAVEALAASEQLHRSILEAAREGVYVTDMNGRTLFVNARMAELLDQDQATLAAGTIWDFLDAESTALVRERFARRAMGVQEEYELPISGASGHRRWLQVAGSPLRGPDGAQAGVVAMFSDITQRKQLEEQLRQLALYDTLTGIPNRALGRDRFEQLKTEHERTGRDFALIKCDVDRFKLVNDAGGHAVGDAVLIAVAQRLREAARDNDTVCRFGGDEFVVLCPGADAYVARRVAERLCAAVQAPIDVDGDPVHVSLSIGVAATTEVPPETLLHAADTALFSAKARGRARVAVHEGDMQTSARERSQLVSDLRGALNSDRLELWYQPIVTLGSDRPAGVEALARWTHPDRGPVSPELFIPLAEESGLITQLGAWSLHRACVDATQWPELPDPNWQVSVNLSGQQLGEPGIVDVVREALEVSGLQPARLMLEVTETAILGETQGAASILSALKALGVGLALDDFGTGYSSLTYLRSFPVDMIKIDRSFVAGLGSNGDDSSIVASLVSLATSVGVTVVAEGVETVEQQELLRSLGCPLGQGFLWSPAVPASELPAVLQRLAQSPVRTTAAPRTATAARTRWARADPDVTERIVALLESGASLETIAAALNGNGEIAPTGTRWSRKSVARVIAESRYPNVRMVR
ncbi:MAG: hypothetical protein JWN35_2382 [Frankiales bacterium]|nr:hypothetical protein [Frankiales bacterium]